MRAAARRASPPHSWRHPARRAWIVIGAVAGGVLRCWLGLDRLGEWVAALDDPKRGLRGGEQPNQRDGQSERHGQQDKLPPNVAHGRYRQATFTAAAPL